MRRVLTWAALGLLLGILAMCAGCSTVAEYGIGGPPVLLCDKHGQAQIDDKLAGSDGVRLSVVRRFPGGDALCQVP